MQAIGYLRKSKVSNSHDVSWEVQEREIRALADKHGDTLDLLSDWGRSGRGEKTRLRPEYQRLRRMVEDGQVSVIYSYSLSRLSRSLSEYASLAELCQRESVKVRLVKEGEFDYSSASGRFTVGILALLAQMEAELAQERAKDTISARRARGDFIGSAGYGKRLVRGRLEDDPRAKVDSLLAAFNEGGSFAGAARLLNQRNVPSPRGKRWDGNTVNRIIRREQPSLVPRGRSEPRVAPRGSHTFSRLLSCSCGQVMTPRRNLTKTKYGSYGPYIGYQCFRGRHDPAHPRPYMVSEASILAWARVEAARLRTPERVRLADENRDRRTELAGQRERLGWAVTDGLLDREQAQLKAAEIGAEMERLADQEQVVDIPTLDWSWEPAELNAVLRSLWERVELDANLRPVRAEWRVPEWRAA